MLYDYPSIPKKHQNTVADWYATKLNYLKQDLVADRYMLKGTFKFPHIQDHGGIFTPFNAGDIEVATDLIKTWFKHTNKIISTKFRAFPEVLELDRRTPTPLHFHALFDVSPAEVKMFEKVAPHKWQNLLKSHFPKSRIPTDALWLKLLGRSESASSEDYEGYIIKQQDEAWNASYALSDDDCAGVFAHLKMVPFLQVA
jgi:hypothetical protein